MTSHPVRFRVAPSPMHRVHILVRLLVLAVLAAIGCSSVYWLLYLALPVLGALLVSRDGAEHYLRQDAAGIVRVVRWFAGAYAYLWLLTDAVPKLDATAPVELEVDTRGTPTVTSALLRLLTSLPALLMLAILSVVAAVLWVIGAIAILATERMPAAIRDFIETTLRYQFRLVAYHLSLVDAYPSLADWTVPHAPASGA